MCTQMNVCTDMRYVIDFIDCKSGKKIESASFALSESNL